jgi:hypothetical protein
LNAYFVDNGESLGLMTGTLRYIQQLTILAASKCSIKFSIYLELTEARRTTHCMQTSLGICNFGIAQSSCEKSTMCIHRRPENGSLLDFSICESFRMWQTSGYIIQCVKLHEYRTQPSLKHMYWQQKFARSSQEEWPEQGTLPE